TPGPARDWPSRLLPSRYYLWHPPPSGVYYTHGSGAHAQPGGDRSTGTGGLGAGQAEGQPPSVQAPAAAWPGDGGASQSRHPNQHTQEHREAIWPEAEVKPCGTTSG